MTTSDKDAVLWAVCEEFALDREDLYQSSRKADICLARHILAYVLYTDCDAKYLGIGRALHRDHSTIISSVAKVRGMLDNKVIAEYLHMVRSQATTHSRACTTSCRAQHALGNIGERPNTLLDYADVARLEDRQRRVLYLIADGLEDAAIAREIGEPPSAISTCVAALKYRVGGSDFSRAALVAWYWKGRMAALEAASKQTPRFGITKSRAA